jgi:energy-coupling factor transport system permease protein
MAISEAQRMRGSAGTRLRDWRSVAAPVVLSALDDSMQMAEAMEARAFGSGPRTRYATAPFDLAAMAVAACSVTAIGLVIAARVTGSLPDWYPFPVATLPDVSVLASIACALLVAPLVAWHRW